jgi:hypothetical protein
MIQLPPLGSRGIGCFLHKKQILGYLAKNDKVDSAKIARVLRIGNLR